MFVVCILFSVFFFLWNKKKKKLKILPDIKSKKISCDAGYQSKPKQGSSKKVEEKWNDLFNE